MTRFLFILLALIFAIPAVVVGAGVSTMKRNDRRLDAFAQQLFAYPPPPASSVLRQSAEVGVLTGNGNHCDYVASVELQSSVPVAELRAHYAGLSLRPAVAGGAGGGLPLLRVEPGAAGRATVVVEDAPYGAGLDPRCH